MYNTTFAFGFCISPQKSISHHNKTSIQNEKKTIFKLRNADHAARRSAASIARFQRIGMAAQAQIVSALVDDHAASKYAAVAGQRQHRVAECRLRNAVVVRTQIAQIADVAHLVVSAAVRHLVGIVVGPEAGAVIGQVSFLVHMEAKLGIRSQTAHVNG